jgi:hypothetical protein
MMGLLRSSRRVIVLSSFQLKPMKAPIQISDAPDSNSTHGGFRHGQQSQHSLTRFDRHQ